MNDRAAFPHCDSNVLHAPGTCEFCDHYPDFQAARLKDGINFTGQNVKGRQPCPATVLRDLDRVQAWGGNRPFLSRRQEGWTEATQTPGYANFSVAPDKPGVIHIELRSPGDGQRTGSQAALDVPVADFNRLCGVL